MHCFASSRIREDDEGCAGARKVLATEVSKVGTHAAVHNIDANGLHNVTVVRLTAEVSFPVALSGPFEDRHVALPQAKWPCCTALWPL